MRFTLFPIVVLLTVFTLVATLPLPMDAKTREGRDTSTLADAFEPLDGSASSSPAEHTSFDPALPKAVRYRAPDYRPWLVKQEARLMKSLSFSSASRRTRESDRAMDRMLRNRPNDVELDDFVSELTSSPKKVLDYDAIQLPKDEALASQALSVMTRRQRPFYAVDHGGRVWFFNTRRDGDRRYFTYNGNLKGGNDEIVRQSLAKDAEDAIKLLTSKSWHGA